MSQGSLVSDIKWYQYLNRGGLGSLMKVEHYSSGGKIIVRRETVEWSSLKTGRAQAYAEVNLHQLHTLLMTRDASTSYHEVCYYTGTAKPRFDIEGVFPSQDICDEIKTGLLSNLESILQKTIDEVFKFKVYDSSGEVDDGYKMSLHVVCHGVHYNLVRECDSFCTRIIGRVHDMYAQYFDKALYGKNHSLRLLGCCKDGTRKKVPMGADASSYTVTLIDLEESLVTYSRNSRSLNNVEAIVEIDKASVELPEDIFKLVQKHIPEEFKYRDAVTYDRGDVKVYDINLTRLKASFCSMCNRVHEKDNTLIINVSMVKTMCQPEITVALKCRRQQKKMSVETAVLSQSVTNVTNTPASLNISSIIQKRFGVKN